MKNKRSTRYGTMLRPKMEKGGPIKNQWDLPSDPSTPGYEDYGDMYTVPQWPGLMYKDPGMSRGWEGYGNASNLQQSTWDNSQQSGALSAQPKQQLAMDAGDYSIDNIRSQYMKNGGFSQRKGYFWNGKTMQKAVPGAYDGTEQYQSGGPVIPKGFQQIPMHQEMDRYGLNLYQNGGQFAQVPIPQHMGRYGLNLYRQGGSVPPTYTAYVNPSTKGMQYGGSMYKDGGIHIKPENKGKFTAWASSHGMGVQEAASHVMANKEDYSSTIVKRANFAKNAAGWKKQYGGMINPFYSLQQYANGGVSRDSNENISQYSTGYQPAIPNFPSLKTVNPESPNKMWMPMYPLGNSPYATQWGVQPVNTPLRQNEVNIKGRNNYPVQNQNISTPEWNDMTYKGQVLHMINPQERADQMEYRSPTWNQTNINKRDYLGLDENKYDINGKPIVRPKVPLGPPKPEYASGGPYDQNGVQLPSANNPWGTSATNSTDTMQQVYQPAEEANQLAMQIDDNSYQNRPMVTTPRANMNETPVDVSGFNNPYQVQPQQDPTVQQPMQKQRRPFGKGYRNLLGAALMYGQYAANQRQQKNLQAYGVQQGMTGMNPTRTSFGKGTYNQQGQMVGAAKYGGPMMYQTGGVYEVDDAELERMKMGGYKFKMI